MTKPIMRWNWTAGETVFEIRQWGAAYEVSYKGPLSGSTDVAGIVGEELIRLTKRIDEFERVTRTLQAVCDSQGDELESLRSDRPAEEPSADVREAVDAIATLLRTKGLQSWLCTGSYIEAQDALATIRRALGMN